MLAWKKMEQICNGLKFPIEATEYFKGCFEKIKNDPVAAENMQKAMDLFFCGQGTEWIDILQKVAEETGIIRDSVGMLFLIVCAVPLQYIYRRKGFSEALYWETLQDLRYKLEECKNVHGHWGTFVSWWFQRFYLCERFKLGRLQFETAEFPYDAYKSLKKGDKVYCCHIPSCGPLRQEDVIDSLKRAYNFYRAELKDGVLPVVCRSWLLYEPLSEVFSDSVNIMEFRALFDVLENKEDETNSDFWRVFNVFYDRERINDIPATTRLQKRLKEYLMQGKNMGYAYGVLFFDGEKLV